ncbi:hypothetical protein AB0K40_17870 [Nonomuraea bangladeshensis]|uniref:PE domain-containing protein n=1 Tax=Nonomuraea bangladeshensis TaxID=404385 RepID=A0ABV3H4C4_9ACTN
MASDDLAAFLDQIDDVIYWDGRSPDAMRWTAEPPKPLIDPEAARQAFARLGEQMQALAEAFRPVVEHIGRNLAAVTEAFAAIVNTPDMQELAHAHRRARSAMKGEYARRRRARGRRG